MGALRASAYQLVPLSKLLINQSRCVFICDGVGVGKTVSAGFILKYLTSAYGKPGLVVCPPTLIDKWYFELRSKFAISATPIRNAEELYYSLDDWDRLSANPNVYILPSSLLGRSRPLHFSGPIVIDEIHNYRNPETQLWKAAKSLVVKSRAIVTP